MVQLPAFTVAPSKVHDKARTLTGHYPVWHFRPYDRGIYSVAHFRICSYCTCVNPMDMISLLYRGRSHLESTNKLDKFWFVTPNPVAGQLVHMGSELGCVFDSTHKPITLRHKMNDPPRSGLEFEPTISEQLAGHFERPALEIAPQWIVWPFYKAHTSDRQWSEILEAEIKGKENVSLSGANPHH